MMIEWNPEMIAVSIARGNRILRTLSVPTEEDVWLNIDIDGGEEAIEGIYDPAGYYLIEGEPEPVPIPPRPEGDGWQFDHDTGEWIDPRTPADLADELQAKRDATHMPKSDLLIALASFEIISWEEADLAAEGQIPASLVPMMESLPIEAQHAARIKWKADAEISRTHQVILSAAYALGLPDELVDQIFGIQT